MKFRLLISVFVAFVSWVYPSFAAAAVKDPAGVWKWTMPGRNGQPEETILKLVVASNGDVTGTLSDRAGEHPLTNVSRKADRLEFTILRDTPNGKVPIDYSLKLDSERPRVSIERPDFAPAARKAGKKRKTEVDVTQENDDKTPKPKG